MKVDAFDFVLPEERIALRPVRPRDASKLLIVPPGDAPFENAVFGSLPSFLREGDLLVFNNTRVIPARLIGRRWRNENFASVEFTLHMRQSSNCWLAFAKGAKRLKAGDKITFGENSVCDLLSATITRKGEGGEVELLFDRSADKLDAAIAQAGIMPLPPYIASKRVQDTRDLVDYQTIYASHDGAVAAPTAGLHFTEEVFAALRERGIGTTEVTLHVGAGTFLPVKADDTSDHKMHFESGEISTCTAEKINRARDSGGRIISVGTTSLRLLESAVSDEGILEEWSGATDIFITPGYRFKAVDGLVTNFHLPRSTLFMLVAAFSGLDRMQAAYAHAIENEFRFYSYGDSSLLLRTG